MPKSFTESLTGASTAPKSFAKDLAGASATQKSFVASLTGSLSVLLWHHEIRSILLSN